jgi:hypothetical protein
MEHPVRNFHGDLDTARKKPGLLAETGLSFCNLWLKGSAARA